MGLRSVVGLLAVLWVGQLGVSHAAARVSCGNRGRMLAAEVDAASAVFVARVEGPATTSHPLPPGHRGEAPADIEMVVTRVFAGSLRVGDRVTVRWEGWSEPEGGPMVGGCRVPATGAGERYPFRMIVIASGDAADLRVDNRSSSERIGPANRDRVRRIARLAARSRRPAPAAD